MGLSRSFFMHTYYATIKCNHKLPTLPSPQSNNFAFLGSIWFLLNMYKKERFRNKVKGKKVEPKGVKSNYFGADLELLK